MNAYNNLLKYCNKDWLTNIFTACGLFGKDKFSIYDTRYNYEDNVDSMNPNSESTYLQFKNGLFQYPSFIIYVDKIVQLICIGEMAGKGKINFCAITQDNIDFKAGTKSGIIKYIQNNINKYDYIQSNGVKIYYFPYAGMEHNMFFSFQQLTKTTFLLENVNGEIGENSNIKEVLPKQILDMIIGDCIESNEE